MEAAPTAATITSQDWSAVEVDRVVPPSGNLWIGGQQVWLGPALSGRQVTLWADAISLHVLAGRCPDQDPAVPARDRRAVPAGRQRRPPGRPVRRCPPGMAAVIEVDRTVNATGVVSLADQQVGVGLPLAGQRVTLRMEGP